MNQYELYPKNKTTDLSLDLFKNPTAEYRGTPFWSWNAKLDKDQLLRQMDQMKIMGFGGGHMHPRTGLATEYMGEEFLEMVKACAEKAEKDNMLAWLYDEDRWPSGGAGGLVTVDPQHRAKQLLFSQKDYTGDIGKTDPESRKDYKFGNIVKLVTVYDIVLENGRLKSAKQIGANDKAVGTKWYAYLTLNACTSWYNNYTYADTLSKTAIDKFIEVTHERYRKSVGKWFGKQIPAIFTDEPNFPDFEMIARADGKDDFGIPWTTDFADTYKATFGVDLMDSLPEVIWERADGKASLTRYRFYDHITERFATAFADNIGGWCDKNKIALTGHLLCEESLDSQSSVVGECMRSYRSFQLPGIDMLCDGYEYSTAKQAQSAVHQYGRPGVLSELYGVTGWQYTFGGHKGHGDWQAALGITVRVPHLAWVSMSGEAKRDYPAAIGYQSPWWAEYSLVENHFSRVNVAMTRGKAQVPVAVVHPIESFWLCRGPIEHTSGEREQREKLFADLIQWLLFGLADFDFVSEGLLPSQSDTKQGKTLKVGEMDYKVVIVPGMKTIRSTTLDRLESFAASGGTVVFAGEIPSLVDVEPSDRAAKLAAKCKQIGYDRVSILDAVKPFTDLSAIQTNGRDSDKILYQLREDNGKKRLFMCNIDRDFPRALEITIKGEYKVEQLDTFTGEVKPIAARIENGNTVIPWHSDAIGSLLATLTPGKPVSEGIVKPTEWKLGERLSGPIKIKMSEPNCLLLDNGQYRIGNEAWSEMDEILRLGNTIRERLGLPPVTGSICQPWADKEPCEVKATVQVRIPFESAVAVKNPQLAVEETSTIKISFDGKEISSQPVGWYVDEAIHTVKLPDFGPGSHEIILEMPYHRKTILEWCYLLGDFGVQVLGRTAKIVEPVKELQFGDWCPQGLPFYGGNVTYLCTVEADGHTGLEIPWFGSPLMSVAVDGKEMGKVAFPPYRIDLGKLGKGKHEVAITVFGNRANSFSAVHNCDPHLRWHGPHAWRVKGKDWCYEYQLHKMGILTGPIVLKV
jgi:hypothetical protein